jgi:hypothetical protein
MRRGVSALPADALNGVCDPASVIKEALLAKKRNQHIRKITISLPQHLLDYADRTATERGVSRSQLVAECIAAMAARDRDALAAEGYCFYAQEAEEFACCCMAASSEVICRCS